MGIIAVLVKQLVQAGIGPYGILAAVEELERDLICGGLPLGINTEENFCQEKPDSDVKKISGYIYNIYTNTTLDSIPEKNCQELTLLLGKIRSADNAAALHGAAQHALEQAGFRCWREWREPVTGGRIDLVAEKDGFRAAIELDCRSPRSKSVAKLRNFDGYRVIVLRGELEQELEIPGIHAVIGVPCALVPREIDAGFEEFWAVYPRHQAKGGALRAYTRALKRATREVILAGARRYAVERAGQDKRYTAMAATWLNQDRWTDEPETPTVVPFHQVRAKRSWAEIQAEKAQDRSNVVDFPAVAAANAWMAVEGEDLDALVCRDDQGPQGGPGAEEPQGAGLLDILPALQAMDNSQEN